MRTQELSQERNKHWRDTLSPVLVARLSRQDAIVGLL